MHYRVEFTPQEPSPLFNTQPHFPLPRGSHIRRGLLYTERIGALDGGGGGVLILHVEFKKAQCRPVEFKKCSCRPVEFKKCSCRPVEFKKCPCPMSLRPKIPHVALSILGV